MMTITLLAAALRKIPGALNRELRTLGSRGQAEWEPFKPVLSVLLAVGVATLLRLDDLSWAAFSGYMVMRGDIRETIPRGFNRMAGTACGAVVGLLLAPAVADDPALLSGALFVVAWIGNYRALTSRYSYAWMFFGLTASMVVTQALARPDAIVHFAATRVAEVVVGTLSCLFVASLFSRESAFVNSRPQPSPVLRWKDWFSEASLERRWPLLEHSTRSALALATLPFVWRLFEMHDFPQTADTSYIVMIVPSVVVSERRHQTIFERMAHRAVGCLMGSATAIASIALFGDSFLGLLITLCAGVWLAYHVQTGREGVSYLGTQFALGLLITLVQGPGPSTSIAPGLERLLGIVIGSAMLCLVILLWPLKDDSTQAPSRRRTS